MTQIVYGLTADCGDGSSSIRWFKDVSIVQMLLDDDGEHHETYYGNEGSPNTILRFPDDLDLDTVGFRFSDKSYR